MYDLPSNYSLKEASYSGGGSITFKGSLEEKTYFESKIFQGGFLLSEMPVHFMYTVSFDFFIIIAKQTALQSVLKNAIILITWNNHQCISLIQFLVQITVFLCELNLVINLRQGELEYVILTSG